MMVVRNRPVVRAFLLMVLCLVYAAPGMALSDAEIQKDIATRIAESKSLQGSRIQVHVKDRLVVLTGEVRLYELKLRSGRIAWTANDVFEVDNEIRVLPRVPLADNAIERRIREIVKRSERLRAAGIAVAVDQGKVLLEGSFLDFADPTHLKHAVAAIEGVVDIDVQAVFVT